MSGTRRIERDDFSFISYNNPRVRIITGWSKRFYLLNIIKPITHELILSKNRVFPYFMKLYMSVVCAPWFCVARIVRPRITICYHSTEKYYKRMFFKGNDTRKLIVGRFLNYLIVILFFSLIRTRKNSRVDKKITVLYRTMCYSAILYSFIYYRPYTYIGYIFALTFFSSLFQKILK